MKRPRVALLCVFHESNTFVPTPTTFDAFRSAWREGEAIITGLTGTQTVVGGFIDGSSKRFDLVPLLYAWATPSGVLTADVLQSITDVLERHALASGPFDGVLVEFHGAAVVEPGIPADGLIASRLRKLFGETPIVAVIDPHANLAAEVLKSCDAVLAYQTNPHVDMAARGRAAARLLRSLLQRGKGPARALVRVPVVAPAIAQATDDQPLRDLVSLAQSVEEEPWIDAASLLFGFAYADVDELGMAALVVGSDRGSVEEAALRLGAECWGRRCDFSRHLEGPHGAVAFAAEVDGVTALVDTGDNVGGGAPGDSTHIVAAALSHPTLQSASTIADAAAVGRITAAGVGATVDLRVGQPSLHVRARVVSVGDGRYANEGPLSAGVTFEMGPTAVLEVGPHVIIVQSRPVMANDVNLFRSVGVHPEDFDAVILKGAAAVRAGWRRTVTRFVDVASPGPTTSDLSLLRFSHRRRPIWPLDEQFEWAPIAADLHIYY